MDSGIYMLTNITNGKVYVGSSKALKSRRYTHFRDLKKGGHCNPHLQYAFTECGSDAFHFAVLEYCAVEDLLDRETWWMDLCGSRLRARGYNLWDARRHECSEETRAKMAALTGDKNSRYGTTHTIETKAKMSVAAKAWARRPLTEEHRANIGKALRGKTIPAEQRAKISASHLGMTHSTEARAKVSASLLGKPGRHTTPHTDEAKAKMSASLKARAARLRE